MCHATPRQDLASLRPRQGKPPLSSKPEHSAAQLHPPEKENPGANRFFSYRGRGVGVGVSWMELVKRIVCVTLSTLEGSTEPVFPIYKKIHYSWYSILDFYVFIIY